MASAYIVALRRAFVRLTDLLWIPSLILLFYRTLYLQLPYSEALEWLFYKSFPALIITCYALILACRYLDKGILPQRLKSKATRLLRIGITLAATSIFIPLCFNTSATPQFFSFIPLIIIAAWIVARRLQSSPLSPDKLLEFIVAGSVLLLLALYACLKVYSDSVLMRQLNEYAWSTRFGLMGFLLLLWSWVVSPIRITQPSIPRRLPFIYYLLLAGILWFVHCIIWEPSLAGFAGHHWTYLNAPAILIQQGGTLLWDVPQQYGPGFSWTLAHLPFDVWNNLFYLFVTVQTFTGFVAAAGISWLFLAPRLPHSDSTVLQWLSFLLTCVAILIVTWINSSLINCYINYALYITPSASTLRFIWGLISLCWCFWVFLRQMSGGQMTKNQEYLGLLIYIGGILWSFESGFFCTVIFIPAYFMYAVRDVYAASHRSWMPYFQRLGACFFHLAIALALLLGSIWLYFKVTLGISPDWSSYWEYALVYQGGFNGGPIDWNSRVQNLVMTGLMLFGIISLCWSHFTAQRITLSIFLIATVSFLWVICAYGIGNSTNGVFTSLNIYTLPVLVFFAVALSFGSQLLFEQFVIRILLIACCTGLTFGALGVRHHNIPPIQNMPPANIIKLMPENAEIEALLNDLGNTPIAILDKNPDGNLRYFKRVWWLPLLSPLYHESYILSTEKLITYYQRFIERHCYPTGWLLVKESLQEFPETLKFLRQHFFQEEVRVHGLWLMLKYRRLEPCPAK